MTYMMTLTVTYTMKYMMTLTVTYTDIYDDNNSDIHRHI